jgi:hypothetical protein
LLGLGVCYLLFWRRRRREATESILRSKNTPSYRSSLLTLLNDGGRYLCKWAFDKAGFDEGFLRKWPNACSGKSLFDRKSIQGYLKAKNGGVEESSTFVWCGLMFYRLKIKLNHMGNGIQPAVALSDKVGKKKRKPTKNSSNTL